MSLAHGLVKTEIQSAAVTLRTADAVHLHVTLISITWVFHVVVVELRMDRTAARKLLKKKIKVRVPTTANVIQTNAEVTTAALHLVLNCRAAKNAAAMVTAQSAVRRSTQ